jgi:hypothetical protein
MQLFFQSCYAALEGRAFLVIKKLEGKHCHALCEQRERELKSQ